MNLLDLQKNKHQVLEEVKKGNTEILNTVDARMKIEIGLALQQEYGVPEDTTVNAEAVEKSFLELLKRQRETEENKIRMHKEYTEKVAKQMAKQLQAAKQMF